MGAWSMVAAKAKNSKIGHKFLNKTPQDLILTTILRLDVLILHFEKRGKPEVSSSDTSFALMASTPWAEYAPGCL